MEYRVRKDGRRGSIHHLAVDGSWRRLGIGESLVKWSLAGLERAGIQKCNICVFRDNAAGLSFWEGASWEDREDLALLQKIIGKKACHKTRRKLKQGCC